MLQPNGGCKDSDMIEPTEQQQQIRMKKQTVEYGYVTKSKWQKSFEREDSVNIRNLDPKPKVIFTETESTGRPC